MKRNVLGILLAGAIGAALITGCGAASSGTARSSAPADTGISPGGWRCRQISRGHPRPDRPYPDDLLRGWHDKDRSRKLPTALKLLPAAK